jgi:glycosyltransferase involved in cell wall biosynthesis
VRRRVAFVDYFATHYRKGLYEELARRLEVDFYFFADERERYWNRKIPLVQEGDFRRVGLRHYRVAGQAFTPRLAVDLSPRRYDAVVKSLNGKVMLPVVYAASRTRRIPFVLWTGMWTHPQSGFHRLTQPLTEHVYHSVEAIVAYGEHIKRFLVAAAGVDPDKVFVAGQAVDAARFTSVRPRYGAPAEILFVGQFEERKGIADLLAAFASLPEAPGRRLRLVGNGSLERVVRAAALADPRIEVVGYRGQEDLPGELARSRCLVLPSITTELDREPWGLVVNEAMHAGVPVVATDAVGAAAGGLVVDGRNGFVVPERAPAALAAALRRVVADPGLAERLGGRAREDVERFNYGAMADAFEGAIEHAIAVRRGRVEVASHTV